MRTFAQRSASTGDCAGRTSWSLCGWNHRGGGDDSEATDGQTGTEETPAHGEDYRCR